LAKDLEPIKGSTEVAVPVAPVLTDLSMDDIVVPKIYLQGGLSNLVQSGDTKSGDLIIANDSEDIGFTKIAEKGGESVRMYVLGSSKTWAYYRQGEAPEYGSPGTPRPQQDPDAWDVWFYYMYVPSGEPDIPVRWRLSKTAGRVTYQAINSLTMRAQAQGSTDPLCIEVKVTERSNRSGIKYPVAQVVAGTPDPDELDKARQLVQLAQALAGERATENEAPETVPQPAFS